jgi:serine/threonine-protein kinase SRPK3
MKLNDEDHSEDEGIEDYKIGGYHPCHVGEVLSNRYVLVQKLGWGHFSTVWLAKDFKHNNYVAVKIMKSSPHYLEASYDEVSFDIIGLGRNLAESSQLFQASRVAKILEIV